MGINIRKINISAAKPNMVIAKNIVLSSGLTVMLENTMLTDRSIAKLINYNVPSIYINDYPQTAYGYANLSGEFSPLPIDEQFHNFKCKYIANKEILIDFLDKLTKKEQVDIHDLFKITSEIIDECCCKGDLFGFLLRLQKTQDCDTIYSHSLNTSLVCLLFGYWLGYRRKEIVTLAVSGLLHDIGKLFIDKRILNKPDKLTDDEFNEIKKHVSYSYELLRDLDFPDSLIDAVYSHHERGDQSGYPRGLKAEEISEIANIVAICDMYTAITQKKTYRDELSPFDAIQIFQMQEANQMPAPLLSAFFNNIAYNYIGNTVQLSNGELAEIVFINNANISKPLLRAGNRLIDLNANSGIHITTISIETPILK